jgi:NAD(P)-dependent dehydrogenase (short-subunit alcohol dehydrogenase family)
MMLAYDCAPMDLGIKDKVALVTGASRNIGRGIAAALAAEGARMILVARGREALEDLRQKIATPQCQHCSYAIDLMAPGGVAQLVESIEKDFGAPDIMVHNLGGAYAPTKTFDPADAWGKVWQYNVGIAHELNRAFIPAMVKKQWGRIVHLSTLSTKTGNGYPPHVAAKFAVDGYVSTVNREVARDGVVLCAVAPGAIYTEGRHFAKLQKENPAALQDYFKNHVPANRLGTPEDVGGVVAFLCSQYASYMSGSIVRVDGGAM